MEICTYMTENTFDSYLYQLVENKQKFIGQIMTSKSPVRSADDIDEPCPDAQSGAIKPKSYTAAQTEPRAVRPGVRCVGYFMLLYRKVTIWPLVQVALGLKVVAEVPLVIWGLWLTAHRTAS